LPLFIGKRDTKRDTKTLSVRVKNGEML